MMQTNLVLLASLLCVTSQNVIITAQGRLRGVSHDGYVSYTGVPYATVSDAAGRFKRAGLAPFWLSIREAPQSQCTATSEIENCLQLDVHVPTATSSPWPVLVWVKGGAGQYHPGKLVQKEIIVVVVSHRLGPIGFLCLNEENIPGNAGAKDVVLALRWVRDNIVAFRGNPSNVVLAGQSFGAAVVEALTLSSMAQDLYHGVILQSGTVLSPWAFNYDAQDRAKYLGNMFGDSDDVTSALLNTKTVELVQKSDALNVEYFPFAMCVEKEFKHEERLLTEAPFDLLTNGKVNSVPMIIGYNSDEAYIFASNIKDGKILKRIISQDMTFLIPEELKFLNERELTQVVRQIQEIYFLKNITMTSVLAYHRDAYFINHQHRSIRLHAAVSQPVYYYQFSHSGDVGVEPEPGIRKTGAAHSDELAYLFPEKGKTFEGDDGVVQQHLIKLWTNFVKHLNPTSREGELTTWEAVNPHSPRVLDIGAALVMKEFPHKRSAQMWDEVYEKYYYGRNRASLL